MHQPSNGESAQKLTNGCESSKNLFERYRYVGPYSCVCCLQLGVLLLDYSGNVYHFPVEDITDYYDIVMLMVDNNVCFGTAQ